MDLPAVPPANLSGPEYSAEPQAGSLLDYWNTIRRRKLSLAIFGVVGLGLGIAITLPQAPVYRASTSLEIQDAKDDALATKVLNPVSDSAAVDSLTATQTQIKILKSRSLIERALDKAHITSLADLERHTTGSVSWPRVLSLRPADESRESLVEKIAKNLDVAAVSQTRIVEVSFSATDPTMAAKFANALTSEFIEQSLEARWQMNHRTSEWLVGQLDELRGDLRRSEDSLQAYAREKGLIYTGDTQSVSGEKLRELQMQLSKAQADRVDRQSRFEIASSATRETVPEILNDSNLRQMETNLIELRKQQADLGITFKPDYSKSKRVRAEIESLESAIENKRTQIVSRIDNELQESQRREQLLAVAYAKQARLVTDDSEKSIQYDMLKHEVDTNRQIYQVMLQRVKESSIASALKASNMRVIDPAKAPRHPYKPNLPVNGTAGLFCGLLLGMAAIVIRSKVDASVQEPGDAGMLLGIPELGIIPTVGPAVTRVSPVRTLFSRENELDNSDPRVIASCTDSPNIADSFRAVLASILFAGARQRQRVLIVASASAGEGKTTMTTNLAVTLANMDRRVLLIDGDIRSPRIHSIFDLDNSAGLTTVLRQIALNDVPTDSFIRETSVPNLHVLTSGPAIQASADLLFSTSMPALVARYRKKYDMVLIDTPPMLFMPDARVLGRVGDAVVLVARAGKTTRSGIQAAYRRFVEDRTPVLGVVLNDWNSKTSAYKHYAAYNEPRVGHVVKRNHAGV